MDQPPVRPGLVPSLTANNQILQIRPCLARVERLAAAVTGARTKAAAAAGVGCAAERGRGRLLGLPAASPATPAGNTRVVNAGPQISNFIHSHGLIFPFIDVHIL